MTTPSATAVTRITATVHGSVNAANKSTSTSFCYGTDAGLVGCATVAGSPTTATGTSATAVSANLVGLTPATTYYVAALAANGNGGLQTGSTISFTTAVGTAQTIDFVQPNDMVVTANKDQTLTATASSSLAVTLTVDTPSVCSIILGKAHALTVGTCTITATEAGDATFQPAPSVTRSFAISDVPTTTTSAATAVTRLAATLNATVNAQDKDAATSFCYGTASNLNGCTSTAGTPTTVTGTTATAVSAGVTGLLPSTQYYFRASATNVNGTTTGSTLSFTTASGTSQTITFTAPTDMLVGADQTVSPTSDSGLGVSLTSSTPATCTVSGQVSTASPPEAARSRRRRSGMPRTRLPRACLTRSPSTQRRPRPPRRPPD